MRQLIGLIAFVVVSSTAVHAQDRLIQLGWLWELSGAALTRLRPMPLMPIDPSVVVLAGSQYVVAPVYLGPGTGTLGYLDVVSGTQGLVPGVSLELPDSGPLPVILANDPRRPRVFIWHGSRISEFSASAGLRDIITALSALPYFSPRELAYSAAADVLAFALPGQTIADASELIVARASRGAQAGSDRRYRQVPGRRPPEQQADRYLEPGPRVDGECPESPGWGAHDAATRAALLVRGTCNRLHESPFAVLPNWRRSRDR